MEKRHKRNLYCSCHHIHQIRTMMRTKTLCFLSYFLSYFLNCCWIRCDVGICLYHINGGGTRKTCDCNNRWSSRRYLKTLGTKVCRNNQRHAYSSTATVRQSTKLKWLCKEVCDSRGTSCGNNRGHRRTLPKPIRCIRVECSIRQSFYSNIDQLR